MEIDKLTLKVEIEEAVIKRAENIVKENAEAIRKATAKDIVDLIDDYPTPTLVPGSDFDLGFNSALHAIKIAINNKYDLGVFEVEE